MKKFLRKIFYILWALVIILSMLFLIDYYIDFQNTKAQSNLLNEITISDTESLETPEFTAEKTERMLKIEELQKENEDIVGWLEIEGTNINYPVLQADDNDFYMNRDYKKNYSSSGSIFLDKDYNWDSKSVNLLLYGHNMMNGTMFKDLLKYKDKTFYEKHPSIRFTTANEDSTFEIISAFQSRVYYKSEQNVFRYYYFVNVENEDEYNEFALNAKNASLYDTGKTANYGDMLMTLSTCAYHVEDGRFAVIARKASL